MAARPAPSPSSWTNATRAAWTSRRAGSSGLLLTWVERQFREMGQPEPDGLALTLVGAYQGMSLLANALRDPRVMEREGARLLAWLDSF